ncbi:MAG: pyrroloquinoline quinone-dependent dehydrogenase [Acidobacteria bacterium]|nr:pyrroloquinoline quinone-dependent dehydrogenase [Acidobacteriota bacterium]
MALVTRRSFAALAALPGLRAADTKKLEWQHYGGDPGATRFAPLDRIKPSNAARLKIAWTHRTGDASDRPATTIECTPVVADGLLYLTSAKLQIRALDPVTGEARWSFDPMAGVRSGRAPGVNRGVTWFEDGKDKRIFAAIQSKLYCLYAKSGELIKSFGENGIVDLTKDFDTERPEYRVTSPAVIFEDTLIIGGGGGEGPYPTGPGHIRGYDVYTGKRKWIFHTIPWPGEFGYQTWSPDSWKNNGGTNNWAGLSVDTRRGWVFVSTGCAAFDFWGGDRVGDNLFSDCVLALDAKTGKRIWHYQTIHHDVWDYDLPAQPSLVTITQRGRSQDAVAQVTKTGMLFLLDRQTGKPIFDVEERPVETQGVDGEVLSKTQPFPVKPVPFARQHVNPDLVTDISKESREFALAALKKWHGGVPFPAPTRQGTIFSPGTLGGALWGGSAFDPSSNLLFVPSSELPSIVTLLDAEPGQPFRYRHKGYDKFVDQDGYPAVKPPWGTLTAIRLTTGDYAWRETVGEFPELAAKGIKKTGSQIQGGCVATAGGLVFLAGTADLKLRAFDSSSGAVLWEHALPAGGYATPCTYEARGKQFVAIACGGGNRLRTPSGDYFVAFTLA